MRAVVRAVAAAGHHDVGATRAAVGRRDLPPAVTHLGSAVDPLDDGPVGEDCPATPVAGGDRVALGIDDELLGPDLESASTRQCTMVDAICRAARRTSRESKPPSISGMASVSPMAMITRTTAISMNVKPRRADRFTRCRLPSW